MEKRKIEKKNIVILGVVILVAIVLLVFLISLFIPKPEIGHEYFTLEPETWIEDNKDTEEENDIEINIFKATRGKVSMEIGQEDYYIEGNIESFFYYGSYKGNDFQTAYLDQSFYNLSAGKTFPEKEQLAKNLTIMRITNVINPKDNVINGFILGKEENGIYSFYIFLDEDWKNKVESTNILWGDDFRDPSTLNIKKFDFSKSKKGIYINEIKNNVNWFKKRPRKGGVIVGEINKNILSKLIDYEEVNVTYIMVR